MPEPRSLTVALAGNANVGKSLSGNESVLIRFNRKWKTIRIGRLVNEILTSTTPAKNNGSEYAVPNDLFVLSLNLNTMKVERKRVTYVFRHTERRKLLRVKTSSGRRVNATRDHNFIVLRRGKPEAIDGGGLAVGDKLPVAENVASEGLGSFQRMAEDLSQEIQVNDDRSTEKLILGNIFWDEISRREYVDGEEDFVYDLCVEDNQNFMLSNGLFVHNSVIFNQLTGLNQTVGNWPGKTVERAEGTLYFQGRRINVLDLPGIYSLSTYSMEEIVARDYIAIERPDVIVNIVDASALERNLYFTIQLLELEVPIVIDLNQVDFAAKKGIRIDPKKLSDLLGIPVVPTVAISGIGVGKLLSTVVDVAEGRLESKPIKITYGKEIEVALDKLEKAINQGVPEIKARYPPRWIAVKLLERDEDITAKLRPIRGSDTILELAENLASQIEAMHGEPSSVVMVSERYTIACSIVREAQRIVAPPRLTVEEKLDTLTSHRILGYPILVAVMATTFLTVFIGGDFLIGLLESFFDEMLIPWTEAFLRTVLPPGIVTVILEGVLSGIAAGVTIALPYIVPFYIILALLEDSGYLPRAAYLMDNVMHRIGLHGKAFIPMLLGFGCTVPACVGCRIMERDRERFLAAFVTVLIPCAARTVVILGLVGRYVGLHAALMLYAFDLVLVFVLGRLAFRALPGEPMGLIMEMPPYRRPSVSVTVKKTWARTKDFVYIAFPLIIGGSVVLAALKAAELMAPLEAMMSPVTSGWLGLPAICGVPLVFGVLRKELTLIMLSELAGTTVFPLIPGFGSTQMIVFSLVTMIYIPCIATIAVLGREFGWRRALAVTALNIALAMMLGGIAFRLLTPFLP